MKKLLLLLGVGLFLFHACSSDSPVIDDTIDSTANLYDVTFDLKDFDVTTRATAAESNNKYVKYRVYYVDSINTFNGSTYTKVRDLEFIAKEGSFTPTQFDGKISFRLPKGNYTIVTFASDKPIGEYMRIREFISGNDAAYNALGVPYNDLTQDMFHGEIDFSVEESSIATSISMQRPIGKINLALDDLDKIPSDVQSLVPVLCLDHYYIFNPVAISLGGVSQFLGGYYANMGYAINDPYSKIAISKNQITNYNRQNPISFHLPNNQSFRFIDGIDTSEKTQNLYLIGFDQDIKTNKDAKIVYRKLIKRNIEVIANQSLTITGSILEDGINVSVNKDWNAPVNLEF